MKRIGTFTLFMLIAVSGAVYAQEKKSKKERRQEQAEKVQKMVEVQEYRFVAQRALPMSGRSVNLTSEFDMSVSGNVINAYLPYYGRAYVTSMDPTEGSISFESKDFDYRIEKAKKDGWIAYVTVKDTKRRTQMILNIKSGGSASLLVNDDTRQSITFSGYIEERKKK